MFLVHVVWLLPCLSVSVKCIPQLNEISPMKRSSLTQQSLNSSTSLVDMLRKPFRRKSVPNSPVTQRSDVRDDELSVVLNLEPQPLSLIVPDPPLKHSLSIHSLHVVSVA